VKKPPPNLSEGGEIQNKRLENSMFSKPKTRPVQKPFRHQREIRISRWCFPRQFFQIPLRG
jgi:hypothetical protein